MEICQHSPQGVPCPEFFGATEKGHRSGPSHVLPGRSQEASDQAPPSGGPKVGEDPPAHSWGCCYSEKNRKELRQGGGFVGGFIYFWNQRNSI